MSNFVALVVEDDALQREVVSELLRDNGLEVVECSTAEAAELVLASTGNELRALVTDINLAGEMSGVELAAYARRKFPCINIVVVSGKTRLSFRRTLTSSSSLITPGTCLPPCSTDGFEATFVGCRSATDQGNQFRP